MSRKAKFTSKKKLAEAVDGYFKSISKTGFRQGIGGEMIKADSGVYYTETVYLEPPTVTGLCLYLGIDRRTWANYCDEKLHPEFSEVTNLARMKFEGYLEKELLTRQKSLQGIIFNLQNNYGWSEKKEVEIGRETRESMERSEMSVSDKVAAILEAARQIDEDGTAPDVECGDEDEKEDV